MPYPTKDWITISVTNNSQLTHNFIVKASCCYDLESSPADWKHLSTDQMVDHVRQMLEVNAIVRSADPIVILIIDEMTQLRNFSDDLLRHFFDALGGHYYFDHKIRQRMGLKTQRAGFQKWGDWQPNVADRKGVGSEARGNWLVVASKHPGSHSLDISNFQVIAKELSESTDWSEDDWESIYQLHWAYGSVDLIVVDASNPVLKTYTDGLLERLDKYCMLDESHWTILDMEMGNEE